MEIYRQRIQQKTNPGDVKYNYNTLDITICDNKIFFDNKYCYNKKYDFILFDDHTIAIGLQHQHLSANHLDTVIGAGTIAINTLGNIIYIDNQSGTFQFTKEQQDDYLKIINRISNLALCKIHHINYIDPHKSTLTSIDNHFHPPKNPNYISTSYYERFLKTMSDDKWKWLLSINDFDWQIYCALNQDIQHKFGFDKRKALHHFYMFGQYERGRAVGYY